MNWKLLLQNLSELVNLDEAGNGDYKKFTSQMLNEKVAWIPRNWLGIN